ncbi:acyltransferase domain-containing protein [Streptomyces gilvosporeus]|uniref:Carrier domain-containing protein n=1 Tax=Streptomyces gilvosporeus TaxID=553510 RepID=A0A1V0TJP3_9ACTN|nr:acyltransferase domain-containing protein [Streptomyces gilvosporeus]ARF53151.1 hypothetical protein B1H19_02225 [Streptomyces gilvosporeus]
MGTKTALLFPGPGSHLPDVLGPFTAPGTAASDALATVDEVAVKYGWGPVSDALADADATPTTHPELLWLGFYATSVVLAEHTREAGLAPEVLMGHSGGEITALAVAGALSVADGARVLCERVRALAASDLAPGAMVVVATDAERLGHLCAALGDWSLALAVDNAPRQSVACGHTGAVAALERLAAAAGWRTTRLAMPYILHNPLLAAAAESFLQAIADIPVRAPAQRVHSPLLERHVTRGEDVRDVLACHLVRPVRFGRALAALHRDGIDAFVECGARRVLTDLVAANLPADVRGVAALAQRTSRAELHDLVAELHGDGTADPDAVVVPPPLKPRPGPAPSPAVTEPRPSLPGRNAQTAAPQHGEPAASAQPDDPSAAPPASTGGRLPGNGALLDELREVYASVLQYPAEVFTDDADLEAELGVSSIKQTEIFAQLLDRFELATPSSDVRVSSFRTLGKIAGLLRDLADRPAEAHH